MSIHFDTFGDANHRQNGEDEGKSGVNEGEEWAKQSNTYSVSVKLSCKINSSQTFFLKLIELDLFEQYF